GGGGEGVWGNERGDMVKGEAGFGHCLAGACRGCQCLTGDYDEDQGHQEGQQREATGVLLDLRRRAPDEQEVTMTQARGTHRVREIRIAASSAALFAVLAVFACSHQNAGGSAPASVVLRVGVPGLSPTNPGAGLRQLTQILSVEVLARLAEDGRPEPSLAADWSTSNNGRSYLIRLRPGVKFHDGSPLTPETVASLLPAAMRETFGPIADDVEQVSAVDANSVEVRFRRPS